MIEQGGDWLLFRNTKVPSRDANRLTATHRTLARVPHLPASSLLPLPMPLIRRILRFNLWMRWVWLALAITLAVWAPFMGAAWPWWIAALVTHYFFITVGFSVGMHRFFAHRSFRTSRTWEAVMLGSLVVALAGVPFTWCRAHLRHHQFSDGPEDPYQVKTKGWRSIFLPYDPGLTRSYLQRWLEDPIQRLANAYYNVWVLGFLGLLWLLGGLPAVTFLWALPVALIHPLRQLYFHYSIHTWGYRSFETTDDSRNNWLIALLAGGEGWHNNHHHDPSNWNFRHRWWELDPGAVFISLIRSRLEAPESP
jgi:stearoyl-CoA desaturase (delta-9 desaturase)